MSQVFPLIDGFVGYGDGREAQLRTDQAWDSEHPLRVARPELFTEPEAAPVEPEQPPSEPALPAPPVEAIPQPAAADPAPKSRQRKAASNG